MVGRTLWFRLSFFEAERLWIVMLKEFRDFALGGNLLDVGIGFVIGAATAAFVGAFTSNLVTPWIALAGGGDMSSKFAILKAGKSGVAEYPSLAAAQADGAAVHHHRARPFDPVRPPLSPTLPPSCHGACSWMSSSSSSSSCLSCSSL